MGGEGEGKGRGGELGGEDGGGRIIVWFHAGRATEPVARARVHVTSQRPAAGPSPSVRGGCEERGVGWMGEKGAHFFLDLGFVQTTHLPHLVSCLPLVRLGGCGQWTDAISAPARPVRHVQGHQGGSFLIRTLLTLQVRIQSEDGLHTCTHQSNV